MKKLIKKSLFATLISAVIVLAIAGCSDDKKPEAKSTSTPVASEEPPMSEAKEKYETFDVPPDTVVTPIERAKFEHDFTAQCAERELKNSTNKEQDEERITKICECITTEVSKTLTDEEAEKFVGEHENPRSLGIKFENASYQCMEGKAKPAEPSFSRPAK
jgi:hypothetical protein